MSDDLDELERQVRSLWGDLAPRPALEAEDRAIAAKLLGKDNYQRLARARSGDRVKYRAPVVTAEYHCFPSELMPGVEHWVITLIENGRRRTLKASLTFEQCMLGIRWLQTRGITAKQAETEYMRLRASKALAKPYRVRSKRFDASWLRGATS